MNICARIKAWFKTTFAPIEGGIQGDDYDDGFVGMCDKCSQAVFEGDDYFYRQDARPELYHRVCPDVR